MNLILRRLKLKVTRPLKPTDFGLSSPRERSAPAAKVPSAWPLTTSPRSPAPSSTSTWTLSSSAWESFTIPALKGVVVGAQRHGRGLVSAAALRSGNQTVGCASKLQVNPYEANS
jgi:hypothetical protein